MSTARLALSAHSLYKWIKAVVPARGEKQSAELVEAKSGNPRLRSEMRRSKAFHTCLQCRVFFLEYHEYLQIENHLPDFMRNQ